MYRVCPVLRRFVPLGWLCPLATWHGRSVKNPVEPRGPAFLPCERSCVLEIGFLNSVLPWVDTGSNTSGKRPCEIIPPMRATIAVIPRAFLVLSASLAPLLAQMPSTQQQQPEFIQQGQQLVREGKLDDALALYRQTLQVSPNSVPANIAAKRKVASLPS